MVSHALLVESKQWTQGLSMMYKVAITLFTLPAPLSASSIESDDGQCSFAPRYTRTEL